MRSIRYLNFLWLMFSLEVFIADGRAFGSGNASPAYYNADDVQRYKRNVAENNTWPNREVPFTVSSSIGKFRFPRICKAMVDIELHICVKFIPIVPTKNQTSGYVYVTNKEDGCYAGVGYDKRRRKPNVLNYARSCFNTRGTIEHELLHVLGLHHEQSRPDRDKYIKVYLENIVPDMVDNYNLELNSTTYGMPYDFDSVMHYGTRSFSRNGRPTMLAKDFPEHIIGQRDGPTANDFLKLYIMYRCNETAMPTIAPFRPIFNDKMNELLSLKRDPNFDKYIESLIRGRSKDVEEYEDGSN